MLATKNSQINLTDTMKKLRSIVGWFEDQEEIDVEKGLENELARMTGRDAALVPVLAAADLHALHASFHTRARQSEEHDRQPKGNSSLPPDRRRLGYRDDDGQAVGCPPRSPMSRCRVRARRIT